MRIAATLSALVLTAALAPAQAESVRSGEYTLYYSAMPSTMIAPDVARAAGITRSSSRALLNVAVRRDSTDGLGEPVPADITANVRNPVGQLQALRMREVREADAIYYLGEARFADRDTLDFEIEATIQGEPRPIRVRFSQQFFTR
jgi:hypothetical protein